MNGELNDNKKELRKRNEMTIQRPADIQEQVENFLTRIYEDTKALVDIPFNHFAYPRKAECRDRILNAIINIDTLMDGLEDAAEVYSQIIYGKQHKNNPDPMDNALYLEDLEPDILERALREPW